jgi:hypothetical protein
MFNVLDDPRHQKRKQDTADAMDDPRAGDRFEEFYTFWMYVVAVNGDGSILVAQGSAPITFPYGAKFRRFETADDFRAAYSYKHFSDYWVCLADRDNDVTGWAQLRHERWFEADGD